MECPHIATEDILAQRRKHIRAKVKQNKSWFDSKKIKAAVRIIKDALNRHEVAVLMFCEWPPPLDILQGALKQGDDSVECLRYGGRMTCKRKKAVGSRFQEVPMEER